MERQLMIDAAYEALQQNTPLDDSIRAIIESVVADLDSGNLRATAGEWVRKAILLYFRMRKAELVASPFYAPAYDKIPLKTARWNESDFEKAMFRMLPGAIVRYGAFIGRDCVLMPCFVNIGAKVGDGSMIDTWATVGSCAQIGKNVHLSGGAGIGGVLEPLQANPVIIGDGAFIGARAEIAEGVEIGEGAVIAMGTFISASTRVVDRETGEVYMGRVPPYAVVVPGSLPAKDQGMPALACAVIVKKVDARTRAKTAINEILRAA